MLKFWLNRCVEQSEPFFSTIAFFKAFSFTFLSRSTMLYRLALESVYNSFLPLFLRIKIELTNV